MKPLRWIDKGLAYHNFIIMQYACLFVSFHFIKYMVNCLLGAYSVDSGAGEFFEAL